MTISRAARPRTSWVRSATRSQLSRSRPCPASDHNVDVGPEKRARKIVNLRNSTRTHAAFHHASLPRSEEWRWRCWSGSYTCHQRCLILLRHRHPGRGTVAPGHGRRRRHRARAALRYRHRVSARPGSKAQKGMSASRQSPIAITSSARHRFRRRRLYARRSRRQRRARLPEGSASAKSPQAAAERSDKFIPAVITKCPDGT